MIGHALRSLDSNDICKMSREKKVKLVSNMLLFFVENHKLILMWDLVLQDLWKDLKNINKNKLRLYNFGKFYIYRCNNRL